MQILGPYLQAEEAQNRPVSYRFCVIGNFCALHISRRRQREGDDTDLVTSGQGPMGTVRDVTGMINRLILIITRL